MVTNKQYSMSLGTTKIIAILPSIMLSNSEPSAHVVLHMQYPLPIRQAGLANCHQLITIVLQFLQCHVLFLDTASIVQ